MDVILSYNTLESLQLLDYNQIEKTEKLKPNCWLCTLIKEKYENKNVVFLGRDDKKRAEIQMSMELFNSLRSDPLFLLKSENLRRLRTIRKNSILDFLSTQGFNIIDNDLDN